MAFQMSGGDSGSSFESDISQNIAIWCSNQTLHTDFWIHIAALVREESEEAEAIRLSIRLNADRDETLEILDRIRELEAQREESEEAEAIRLVADSAPVMDEETLEALPRILELEAQDALESEEREEAEAIRLVADSAPVMDDETLEALPRIRELEAQDEADEALEALDRSRELEAQDEADETLEAVDRIRELEAQDALRVRNFESESAPDALKDTAKHSLAVVVRELFGALNGEEGLTILMLSCPFNLEGQAQEILQNMLSTWLDNFRRTVRSMPVQVSEEASMSSLAAALRGVTQLVAVWHADRSHEEIVNLSKEWVATVLVNLTGKMGAATSIFNSERLKSMFSSISAIDNNLPIADVSTVLKSFGCSEEAVSSLREAVARALLRKLRDWQETDEEEIFTSRPLLEDGRLTPGLGLVVRDGAGEGEAHVFVYDIAALRLWVEKSHCDPSTRQALNVGEILEIS